MRKILPVFFSFLIANVLSAQQTTPYTANFDGLASDLSGTFSNGWTASPSGSTDYAWFSRIGSTLSVGTGPDKDHTTGSGTYIYTEASNGNTGDTAYLESPLIDISNLTNPRLKYYYHKYGIVVGDLYVEVFHNNSWVVVDTISGQTQFSNSDPWKLSVVSLSQFSGTIKLRFTAVNKGWFEGDIAIDDVLVQETPAHDLSVTSVSGPASGCGLSSSESITMQILNVGPSSESGFPVSLLVNGSVVATETVTASVAPGSSLSYTFTAKADLSAAGTTYDVEAVVKLSTDGDATNDTSSIEVEHYPLVTAPFTEDFESLTSGNTGKLSNDWNATPLLGYRWEVRSGSTPTPSTGPTADHTTGGASGKYIFVEASGGNTGDIAYLTSPCIDLGSLSSPQLSFWYHKYGGAEMGTLITEVYASGSWTILDSIPGVTQVSETDPWKRVNLSLDAFSGQVIQLRFSGKRKNGCCKGDISIDDLQVKEKPTTEVALVSVSSSSDCGLTSSEPITIQVANNGVSAVSNVPVVYTINAGSSTTEVIPGSINPGDTAIYTFASPADLSVSGILYKIKAYTTLTGDPDQYNDTSLLSFYHANNYTSPYFENFDSLASGAKGPLLSNGWEATPFDVNSFIWMAESGTTLSSSTGPSVDHTTGSSGIYMYTEASEGASKQVALLTSPCINLSANPVLSFWYHKYGVDMGDLYVDVFSNDTWNEGVAVISGETHTAGSDVWVEKRVNLQAYAGTTVRVRFRGEKGADYMGDMAIDDVSISEANIRDLAIIRRLSPFTKCELSINEAVTIQIYNKGDFSESNFNVAFAINGTQIATETISSTIAPGDTLTYTFAAKANLSNDGAAYKFKVFTLLANDTNKTNDTLDFEIFNTEDEGKSEEEIAAITEPQVKLAFEATGVALVENASAAK